MRTGYQILSFPWLKPNPQVEVEVKGALLVDGFQGGAVVEIVAYTGLGKEGEAVNEVILYA